MFPDLVTARLRLRRLRGDDVPALLAYRGDPTVARYQTWAPANEAEVTSFVAEQSGLDADVPGTWFQLAIALGAADGTEDGEDELAGDCGLHFPAGEPWQAEVGVTLARWAQGRGYAREAVEAVLAYLFDTLGKHRVYAAVDPRNAPSVRLLERLGMRREAHFRESLWDKGEWCDDVVYAILAEEWSSRRAEAAP